ncbi:MAG TPA: oligosaccharide flippase family protein [Candidatus Peribacteraceae bacterium]|nr:oligosaccharide flippase family protein [Candidatus Peribacteraceae bacterium]
MSTKQIATSTFWQIVSQALTAILSIVATKFVAIGLSKEFAGLYNSAYGYIQVFAILADFGLYAVAIREISKVQGEEREKTLGVLLWLRILTIGAAMIPALFFVWIMPMWRGTLLPLSVTIASLVPIFTLVAGVIRTVYQVHYRMEFVTIAEVAQRLLTTLGLGLFIIAGVRLSSDPVVLAWYLGIGGIGAFALLLISYIYAQRFERVRLHFDRALLKKFFLLAAPFAFAYLLMALYRQLDVVFIALLRPDFALQNAYYGFAGRVEDMAFLIPTFLLNSVLPILTERLHKKEDAAQLLQKTFFILLVSGTVFFLFSFFWAKPFTLLFATAHYLSAADHPGSDTAFMLMSIPMFLNGLVLFAFYVFLAQHFWKRLMVSFGIGAILVVILNVILTGTYGFVGAASALIAVHVVLTLVLVPAALRSLHVRVSLMQILQWLVFSIILGALLFFSAPHLTSALLTLAAGVVMLPVMAGLAYLLRMQRLIR